MGYTHNWYRPGGIGASTFDSIGTDFQKVLPALEAAGSPIANAYGLEEPEFTADYIRFNGVRHCGHTPKSSSKDPVVWHGAAGIGSNAGISSGTMPFRTCNGDCSYESVRIDRCEEDKQNYKNGLQGGICKTAFRPNDLVVTVFLLIAKHHHRRWIPDRHRRC